MDSVDVSDLEEGEILEYDICSPENSVDDRKILGIENNTLKAFRKDVSHRQFGFEKHKTSLKNFSSYRRQDYLNSSLFEKLKLTDSKLNNENDSGRSCKLEGISSSDGEYRSDEDRKCSLNDNIHLNVFKNEEFSEERLRRKKRSGLICYGTAEDIMSQIDQTICRKSRCNYKRRKSRELKYNLEKMYSSSLDKSSQKVYSSHFSSVKSKKHAKRKPSCSDSDSDVFGKCTKDELSREQRLGGLGSRKKKKTNVYYYNDEVIERRSEETILRNKKIRDFDEVRKNLLEKLKKQKAEEESKGALPPEQRLVNSEIQEVEMLIDATNYVDNPSNEGLDDLGGRVASQLLPESDSLENEGDDEMDLTKLRLIALASNKRRKNLGGSPKTDEKAFNNIDECSSGERKSEDSSCVSRDDEDTDLDRNELLLRAEALKTALLKKHQKRLGKLRVDKSSTVGSSSDNEVALPTTPEPTAMETNAEERLNGNLEMENVNSFSSKLDEDAFKENVDRENDVNKVSQEVPCDLPEVEVNKSENSTVPDSNPKKRRSCIRSRKKKRKSSLPVSNVKENNAKVTELAEEDDRTLRSQLLCDLIKKKSMKDMEKKSVLMDSMQTSVNRAPMVNNSKTKVNLKPAPVANNFVLRKVNVPKAKPAVPVLPPKIPEPEIQRIIVHLGSDESSDDELGFSDPQNSLPSTEKKSHGTKEVSTVEAIARQTEEESIQARCERSVELLLSEARKKIEGEMEKAKKNSMATPEAVYKHLPPSQRLEYIRLKQKIIERERLRKLKKEIPSGSSTGKPQGIAPKTPIENGSETLVNPSLENVTRIDVGNQKVTPAEKSLTAARTTKNNSKPESSKASSSTRSTTFERNASPLSKYSNSNRVSLNGKAQKSLVFTNLKNVSVVGSNAKLSVRSQPKKYVAPPKNEAKAVKSSLLIPTNQALIAKLKLLLKKIKIEKTIEENYEKEITKLKNQLSLFEKKKSEQRFKIKKLAEESMKTYKVIQTATLSHEKNAAKSEEKKVERVVESAEKEKSSDGQKKESEVQNVATEGIRVEEELKSEIIENEPPEDKQVNSVDSKVSESVKTAAATATTTTTTTSTGGDLSEYNSPLEVFSKASDSSERVDPNVIMCQFDLMGICKDEECTYQHLRTPVNGNLQKVCPGKESEKTLGTGEEPQ